MTSERDAPLEIFFSYSHKDERLKDELVKHLSILKRQGVITAWHNRKITAGSEWAGEIDTHLNSAHIILLLISADFLASDYCYDIELKRAMERHEAGETRVIPVILRPVDWHGAPFGKLQALPTDARPVASWRNRDMAFANVANGIRAAAAASDLSPPRSTSGQRLSNLPAPLTGLVGREKDVSTVRNRLFASIRATMVSIVRKDGRAIGAGFFINQDGFILTTDYISEMEDISVEWNNVKHKASRFAHEEGIGLLKIEGHHFPFLPISANDKVAYFDTVFALTRDVVIGWRVGSGQVIGVESSIESLSGKSVISVNLRSGLGTGGTPIVDANGHVVGMIYAVKRDEDVTMALPVEYIVNFLKNLNLAQG